MLERMGSFEFEGKSYPFASVECLGVRDAFEEWMLRKAWAQVQRLTAIAPDTDHTAGFRQDVETLAFTWGTTTFYKFFHSSEGQRALIGFQFELADVQDHKALVDRIFAPTRSDEDFSKDVRFLVNWPERPKASRETSTPDPKSA